MNKFTKRALAVALSASIVAGSIEVSNLLDNKFYAATINDKTIEEFQDEVSGLYDNQEIEEMLPDITLQKDSDNDGIVVIPVDSVPNDVSIVEEQENLALIAVDDIIDNTDYEIINEDKESITISKPFQAKTLIVKSPVQIDTYNASTVVSGYGDLYILKYDTEEDTKEAYEKLSRNKRVSVEIDSVVMAETFQDVEETSTEESTAHEDVTDTSEQEETLETDEETNVEDEELGTSDETTEDELEEDYSETESSTEMNTEEESMLESEEESTDELTEESTEEITEETTEETTEEMTEEEKVEIPDGFIAAIIDSGIDKNNSKFNDKLVDFGLNFSSSGDGIQDDNGHGTAMASIISDNSDAYIMPIKIANKDGKGTVLGLYLGIMAAIENEADLINISMTTSNSDLISSAISEAISNDITVVAAAGNQSADVSNYSPANIKDVITVAALDENYVPASYSNYGEIDYTAVGTKEVQTLHGYETLSGTSIAAAYVSSVISYCEINGDPFNNYVHQADREGYGKGVVSFSSVVIPEKEQVDVEGFDFKIKQEEAQDGKYKIEILTNEDNVKFSFDGGETWQSRNFIIIDRDEEFSSEGDYVCSVRTLGMKNDDKEIFRNYSVIDYENEDPEVTVQAAMIDTVSSVSGTATYQANSTKNHDKVTFTYNIGNTGTNTDNDSNTAKITGYLARGTGTTIGLNSPFDTVKVKYNKKTYTLKTIEIGNGTSPVFSLDSGATSPTTLEFGANIKKINNNAFKDCISSVETITFGSNITSIGNNAFSGATGVSTINIPNSVTNIGSNAFYGCTSINTLKLGTGVTTIGSNAFYNCPLSTKVTVQSNITSHGNALQGHSTAEIIITNGVTKISANLFENNRSLTKLTIKSRTNNNNLEIGASAFKGCTSLSNIRVATDGTDASGNAITTHSNNIFPGLCTTIGDYAFYNTNISTINLNTGMKTLGENTFKGSTPLTTLTIKSDISGHNNAFNGHTGLTTLNIGSEVKVLYQNMFRGCSNLNKVNITGSNITDIGDYCFFDCKKLCDKESFDFKAFDASLTGSVGINALKFGGLKTSGTTAGKPTVTINQKVEQVKGNYFPSDGIAKVTMDIVATNASSIDGQDYVICLDNTGSMDDSSYCSVHGKKEAGHVCKNGGTVVTQAEAVLNSLKLLIETILSNNSKNRICITSFHSNALINVDFTSDKQKLIDKINSWKFSNNNGGSVLNGTSVNDKNEYGTDWYHGIICAMKATQMRGGQQVAASSSTTIAYGGTGGADRPANLIFISDGEPNINEAKITAISKMSKSVFTNSWSLGLMVTETISTQAGKDKALGYLKTISSMLQGKELFQDIPGQNLQTALNDFMNSIVMMSTSSIYNTKLTSTINNSNWEFYKGYGWSNGVTESGNTAYVNIGAMNSTKKSYSYYVRLKNTTRSGISSSGTHNFKVLSGLRADYKISGGQYDGTTDSTSKTSSDTLPWYAYDVKYNGNGNTGGSTSSQVKVGGINMNLRSNGFTKTAYKFKEWNTKADGTGTKYTSGATYSANEGLTLYAIWGPDTTYYTVKHWLQNIENNNYTEDTTQRQKIDNVSIGSNQSPNVKTFTGFTSPQKKTVTIAANGATVVDYYYTRNKYSVNYIDRIKGTTTQLGKTNTVSKPYGASVRGADMGSNTATGTYHTGYDYVSDTSATVGTNGATVYRYFSPHNYTVTYIDIIDSTSGKELGRQTALKPYNSTVRGSEKGSNTADNAYYKGYYYVSDTSATVTTNGAIVYRVFKLRTVDKTVTVKWEDYSNRHSSRPDRVTLLLMNGNSVAASHVLPGNSQASQNMLTYTFKNMQKYDTTTGAEIRYRLVEGATKTDNTVVKDFVPSMNGALEYELAYGSDLLVTNKTVVQEPPADKNKDYGVTVSGSIQWKDDDDKYHFRPDSATIILTQNGKEIDRIVLPNGTTDFKFTGLDFYDENGNEYKYEIKEESIDYYQITMEPKTEIQEKTDEFGNTVTTKKHIVEVINTFSPNNTPDNPGPGIPPTDPDDPDNPTPPGNPNIPMRDGNNQLTMKASYVTENGAANNEDFDRISLDRDKQVLNVTLKQLNLIWKPISEQEGKYQEIYEGYSGHVVTMNLKGEKETSINQIAYGKYEIVIDDVSNFTFKDITELSTKDVVFSFEDGKYYVTYSYETLEAKESLSVNMLIDNWNGYTTQQKISNFFMP